MKDKPTELSVIQGGATEEQAELIEILQGMIVINRQRAKTRRDYYLKLIDEGFSKSEALVLCQNMEL